MTSQGGLLSVAGLTAATAVLLAAITSVVPEPYMDEIFHIPQAQKYCYGKFKEASNDKHLVVVLLLQKVKHQEYQACFLAIFQQLSPTQSSRVTKFLATSLSFLLSFCQNSRVVVKETFRFQYF